MGKHHSAYDSEYWLLYASVVVYSMAIGFVQGEKSHVKAKIIWHVWLRRLAKHFERSSIVRRGPAFAPQRGVVPQTPSFAVQGRLLHKMLTYPAPHANVYFNP
jgi:hypothetical protein